MISLIEPTYKTNLWVSPVAPIYKTPGKRQSHKNEYLDHKKGKIVFKDVLDIERAMGLGSKISVRV